VSAAFARTSQIDSRGLTLAVRIDFDGVKSLNERRERHGLRARMQHQHAGSSQLLRKRGGPTLYVTKLSMSVSAERPASSVNCSETVRIQAKLTPQAMRIYERTKRVSCWHV
jgi:hypothetical protein